MIQFVIVVVLSTVNAAQVSPAIVYKYSDAYELIWKDEGSGAHMYGSVWRVRNYQSDYCSLGDAATGSYNWKAPTAKAVLVSQKELGALVNPSYFIFVWKDRGTGANKDVAIYKMVAPPGYTCLGGVAVNSWSTPPDPKNYCCVKNQFLVLADTIETWNDKGSGAHSDVSLWTVIRAGGDAYGLDAGNFIATSTYSKPSSSTAFLLKDDGSKVMDAWSLPKDDKSKPLNLYEVGEFKLVWNDKGTGAHADVSIWRAESRKGFYSLGDIVVATHAKPKIGFLLKPRDDNDNSVRSPVSYSKIWNDSGSRAYKDVQLWNVNCPGGYVSLGNVATDGNYPKLGDVYCVKRRYTSYGSSGNWGYIWSDHGSKARSDVSIYEAQPTSSNMQSVRGFGAVASYNYKPSYPYFLRNNSLTYWAEKPIEKIYMFNVRYDLNTEKQQSEPVQMSPTVVENFSDRPQTATRTISYSVSESSSFQFSQAIELGIEVEFTAGSPLIGVEQETSISVSTTSTFSTGQTTTKTHTDSINAQIELPGKSKITAVISGTKCKTDIPYTATITKVYYDGSEAQANISGVYKGVAISDIKVTYSEIEYFN